VGASRLARCHNRSGASAGFCDKPGVSLAHVSESRDGAFTSFAGRDRVGCRAEISSCAAGLGKVSATGSILEPARFCPAAGENSSATMLELWDTSSGNTDPTRAPDTQDTRRQASEAIWQPVQPFQPTLFFSGRHT
jgi:hypothetical protein